MSLKAKHALQPRRERGWDERHSHFISITRKRGFRELSVYEIFISFVPRAPCCYCSCSSSCFFGQVSSLTENQQGYFAFWFCAQALHNNAAFLLSPSHPPPCWENNSAQSSSCPLSQLPTFVSADMAPPPLAFPSQAMMRSRSGMDPLSSPSGEIKVHTIIEGGHPRLSLRIPFVAVMMEGQ